MTRVRHRLREHALDVAAGSFALVYFALLLWFVPGSPAAVLVGEVAFFPPGLLLAWLDLRNARAPGLDRRTRQAWMLLAGASFALWLSGNAWGVWLYVHGPGKLPAWIDRIGFAQYFLSIAGYLAFPSRPRAREARLRHVLDLGLTVVAGFVLAFHFGVVGLLHSDQIGDALIEAALEWALFVIAAVGYLNKRDPAARTVLGVMLAANSVYLMCSYLLSRLPVYLIGDPIDALWFAAWILRFIGARVAWFHYRAPPPARDPTVTERALDYRSGAFSYLIVGAAFVLLVTRILQGDAQYLGVIATSTGVMATLLVARQLVELRENERLIASTLAQEARFRSLVLHSSDVVLVADGAGRVSYVSPSAERVFGAGSPVRPGAALAELVRPEDAGAVATLLEEGVAESRLTAVRMKAAGVGFRDVEILSSDLRRDPAVGGVVLTCRDVTDRNELERELRHAQKLDAVGQLAGGLAHDFNNVLTVIRGFADLLRSELPPGSDAAADVEQIQEAADRAAAVTKKLLSLSRRQSVQRSAVDLNALLAGLQPILKQLVTDRVQVELQCAPGLWPVLADAGQLEQVVINLAANARDAMTSGGTLRIATSNRPLANGALAAPGAGHAALPPGDYVALLVADQGTGMSDEVQARIFEPFFSTKPAERGMGLGLAMVRRIVTETGGQIAVESAPGAGAIFTALLPRSAAIPTPPPAREQVTRAAQARTVLVVDDEASIRLAARRILERGGHRVVEAADGHAALALIARADTVLDLLVTDLVMADVNGREVIERARALRPGLRVVCITGFAGGSEDLGDLGPSVAAVLAKPFSAEALLRAVNAALATRALE